MCRTQCMLALVALYVGLAHSFSWEYVVTTDTTLEFYANATLTHSEYFGFEINYLTYDAVHNRLLFLDGENTRNLFLHCLNLATMQRQYFFMRKMNKRKMIDEYDYIHSLAYDPVTELVFFSNSEAIFWFSLKPGFVNNINGNLLIKSIDKVFFAIAVDSCRGYIYWTYSDNWTGAKIERARLNGSDREILQVNDPGGFKYLVIDQQTQKLYWIDEYSFQEGYNEYGLYFPVTFSIQSRTLNGDKQYGLCYKGDLADYRTTALTVSKDFIYWMESRYENITVWKLQKNDDEKCDQIYTNSFTRSRYSIVANYKIEDQTQGVQDCEALISKNSASNDNSLSVPTNESLVCQNYCIQGNCSVIEGQAICRCDAGCLGDRCEVNICQGYCLNDGDCYLNEESKPVCQCKGDYGGQRCEVSVFLKKCFQTVSMLKDILNTDVTPAALDYGGMSTCGTTSF